MLIADARHAFRGMRRAPGFTLAVMAVLALGIGANTAIFTVVNTVLLQPLPYPDSDRLATSEGAVPEPMFAFWEHNNPGLEDVAAYQAGGSMNLNGGEGPELVEVIRASRNYFRLFGANPILGRTFTAAEDRPGGPRVLVMSHGLWQRRFGGDPRMLGKPVTLGGAPCAIIGVLAPGFQPYPPGDVWVPLQADVNSTNVAGVLQVSGRLPAGTTLGQANSQVAVIATRYAHTSAQRFRNARNIRLSPLQQQITGDIRPALLVLLGAVGLVLLMACANVANLLLARATGRRKEIAIRAAIGAGRARIVRQLLTESLLLALAGGTLGLVLGSWGVRALLALTPGDLPRAQEMASLPVLDPRVAAFTFLLAVLTGVLFGLFPALQLACTELTSSLKESAGRTGTGLRHNRVRGMLLVAEVAIAVVLSCGAVLLIRSFAAMHNTSLGFDPRNVLTMEVSLAGPAYARSSDVDRIARQFVERAERIPGVASAAVASALPLTGRQDMIFDIPGRRPPQRHLFTGDVQWRIVSAHYFEALRIPLLAGRLPGGQEPGRTVVISQAMARKYWPDANPVGQSIFIGPALGPDFAEGMVPIVGVVGDVRERLDTGATPLMYQAFSQIPDAAMALVNGLQPSAILVRTRPGVAPMSVSRAVQRALLAGERMPAAKIRTMEQVRVDSVARQKFNLLLLGVFATVALLLAAVGIYGVMSYMVAQRTHEIGIRAALGANRGNTLALVVTQALRMALAGIAAGVAASFALTRLLRAELFGVKPSDPLTFAAVPLLLFAVAFAAACIPALRASRIDPIAALRQE